LGQPRNDPLASINFTTSSPSITYYQWPHYSQSLSSYPLTLIEVHGRRHAKHSGYR
jgi:hypothetical protein